MSQKIIITGGCGYIGSHTTVILQQNGFDVVIIDNLINSHKQVLDGITNITGTRPEFENCDCTNRDMMHNVFSRHADAIGVIHFAALKAVGESVAQPIRYYRNNITSLLNTLDMMMEFKIPNIVFSSSATVYGEPDNLPVLEDTPLKSASSPYGQTKIMGENIIADVVRANPNMHATILRYFNPIGAHPTAQIGELPLGTPNNLLPFITQTAAGIRECLNVFGNDYDTPDGFCIRDYIDVNDLAAAHLAALNHMIETGQDISIYNLGTGRGISVMEMIECFQRASGQKLNYKIVPRRPGDVAAIWANCSRANKELGWHAKINLEDTLASAWEWQKHISKLN